MSTSHLVWFKLKLSRLVVVLVSLTTVLADIYQFRDHGAGWLWVKIELRSAPPPPPSFIPQHHARPSAQPARTARATGGGVAWWDDNSLDMITITKLQHTTPTTTICKMPNLKGCYNRPSDTREYQFCQFLCSFMLTRSQQNCSSSWVLRPKPYFKLYMNSLLFNKFSLHHIVYVVLLACTCTTYIWWSVFIQSVSQSVSSDCLGSHPDSISPLTPSFPVILRPALVLINSTALHLPPPPPQQCLRGSFPGPDSAKCQCTVCSGI